MKKQLFLLLVFLVPLLMAEGIMVNNSLSYNSYNADIGKMQNRSMQIQYDPNKDYVFIAFDNYDYTTKYVYFQMESHELCLFDSVISKYKKWNLKASKESIDINKKITSLYPESVYFTYNRKLKRSANSEVICEFITLENNKYYLKFYCDMTAQSNEYIDNTFIALLNFSQVIALEQAIQPEQLKKYKAKALETVKIESEFE